MYKTVPAQALSWGSSNPCYPRLDLDREGMRVDIRFVLWKASNSYAAYQSFRRRTVPERGLRGVLPGYSWKWFALRTVTVLTMKSVGCSYIILMSKGQGIQTTAILPNVLLVCLVWRSTKKGIFFFFFFLALFWDLTQILAHAKQGYYHGTTFPAQENHTLSQPFCINLCMPWFRMFEQTFVF